MIRRPILVLALALAAAPALAQTTGSVAPLQRFEGRFVGKGTLARGGGSPRTLNCDLAGRPSGDRLSLSGVCRAMVFASANISIDVRCSGQRCTGSFRDGLGTISSLAGQQRGDSLSLLATETAESVRPDPPARMTLTRKPDGIGLSVQNTQPGKGSAISLDLKKQ
jgi:hypothetical protein